jgi:hypothetical protein
VPAEEQLRPEWREVAVSYTRENARLRKLRSDADLGVPYWLVSDTDLRSLMRQAGIDLLVLGANAPGREVFATFPGGRLIAFSAVGFNQQRTRATVALQFDCFRRPRTGRRTRFANNVSK